tara:strand:- start:2181 stop:4277 length:2097 start_codon:yes stop_codon:yes gene_type:complete
MAKRKLRKPLLLQEEFAAGEVSNPNQNATPAVQTNTNTVGIDKKSTSLSGEEVRAEIVKDVDTILTNLEALSKQITESVLNESLDELLKGVMSKVAFAQGEGYLSKYTPLLQAANQNLIDKRIFDIKAPLEDAIEKLTLAKEKAKGEAKKPLIKKIEDNRQRLAKVESRKEAIKAKADADVEKLKVKMTKAEGLMTGALKDTYMAQKAKATAAVNIEGLKAKAEMALAKDKKDAADKIALEMQELAERQKEIEGKIKRGESQSKEDLAELDGIKPFIKEVSAFADATEKADEVRQKIGDAATVYESFKEGLDYAVLLLESDIMTLYNGAKKQGNVADISKAKTLAAALKKVEAEVYKTKKALYDKVASTTVTNKSIIDLAGGDTEKIGGKEGAYKIGELKAKWGGAGGFVKIEDYAPIKNAQEIEDNADQAIEDAELKAKEKENEKEGEGKFDEEKVKKAIDDAQKEFDGLPKDTEPAAKAKVEVKLLKAKIAMAKGKGEDTADLETELTRATKSLTEKPTMKVKKNEPQDPPVEDSVEIDSDLTVIEEASVHGLQVYDAEDDGYKWFTGTFAKKFNVKVTISDEEPWSDIMSVTGKKADILKFVDATGHGDLVGDTEEFPHQIEEGNAFGAARAEAIAKGEDKFKVGDEEYDVEGVDADDKENAEEYAEEEGIATEAVTESASFKMGSVADRFRSLM